MWTKKCYVLMLLDFIMQKTNVLAVKITSMDTGIDHTVEQNEGPLKNKKEQRQKPQKRKLRVETIWAEWPITRERKHTRTLTLQNKTGSPTIHLEIRFLMQSE